MSGVSPLVLIQMKGRLTFASSGPPWLCVRLSHAPPTSRGTTVPRNVCVVETLIFLDMLAKNNLTVLDTCEDPHFARIPLDQF